MQKTPDYVRYNETDFVKDVRVISPKWLAVRIKDLMTRSGYLYAVFDPDTNMWIRDDEGEARYYIIETVDNMMSTIAAKYTSMGGAVKVKWMWDTDSGSLDKFIKYIRTDLPENRFHTLDQKIIFSNTDVKREDYASKKLPYPLMDGDRSAYETLIGTLYDPEEKEKLEWAIGAIISGDSKKLQKFIVLHGESGAGKSTFLKIVEELFEGYTVPCDFKGMGKSNNDFATESFKNDPLVAIQHDGDLSRIEDNTLLNQIVSHEKIEINPKNKSKYPARINAFLFMGTNRPVKITEARSGIIRRLIDVKPSGRTIKPVREYNRLMKLIGFELGAIAYHCLEVYNELGPDYYDDYIPIDMLAATNDFFDFMVYRYDEYAERDAVTQDEAWKAWKEYCQYTGANQSYYRVIGAELRAYFRNYEARGYIDGIRVRNLYSGFRKEKFENKPTRKGEKKDEVSEERSKGSGSSSRNSGNNSNSNDLEHVSAEEGSGRTGAGRTGESGRRERGDTGSGWLIFKEQPSLFDQLYADCPAQYETEFRGNLQPEKRWANVKTTLKDLDTSKTHYVLGPSSLIFIDFDKKNAAGEKDFELNRKAAEKLPPTYAELSKSGGGIHLYYIYQGDVSKLNDMLEDQVEIKVCPEGKKSAIRRMLTKCNDIPPATISSGLPLKGDIKKLVNWEGIKDEKHLRNIIGKCLRKEGSFGPHTSENIQEIKKALDNAYASGMHYDVSDLKLDVMLFASKSSNQKDICQKMVEEMHFESEGEVPPGEPTPKNIEVEALYSPIVPGDVERPIVLDIEVYPPDEATNNEGLFLVCWKYLDSPPDSVVAMINPKPWEVEALFYFKIIGFNIREYDAPMLMGKAIGDSNAQSYDRSYRIINLRDNSAKPKGSTNIPWIDVYEIYKAAGEGTSLKKLETKFKILSEKTNEELTAMGYSKTQIKGIDIFRHRVEHKEMAVPWDKPIPKERWDEVIEYCKNDVNATEAAYWFGQNFINARQFQVNLVKALHNNDISAELIDTANTLSKRAIFGNNKNPQSEFNYRDLSKPVGSNQYEEYLIKFGPDYKFRVWDDKGLPLYRDYIPGEELPDGYSILPFFPGYTFNQYAKTDEKSTFMGEHGGEGGRVFSLPGFYSNVWDGDIASQYPHSIIAEVLFGVKFTKIFAEIVEARLAVKHKDFEKAGKLLNGALKPFLSNESAKELAQALKIIINAVYGLTCASFANEFKDPKNIDNIVAKRGNLFMQVLKTQIELQGYKVCHIKTDSIKIPDADQYIQDFVIRFGKEYGYTFETEGYFDKFVLLNDAAYVAHDINENDWITKAKQFQEPYVRKTLFTQEPVSVDDLIQTLSVSSDSALYLDLNEGLPDYSAEEKLVKQLNKKIAEGKLMKGYSSIEDMVTMRDNLAVLIPACHNMQFVGRVGSFLPVVSGAGGGPLYRVKDGNNFAASGTSGYLWLESDYVRMYNLESKIDMSFYQKLAKQAKDDISEYCEFDWFINATIPPVTAKEKDPLISVETVPLPEDFMNIPQDSGDEVPWT